MVICIGAAGMRALWKKRNNAMLLGIVAKNVCLSRRAVFVERQEITKNETNLILFVHFGLWLTSIHVCCIAARKDHIVD